MWSPSTIPVINTGKERWRYFLNRPEVIIADMKKENRDRVYKK